MQVLYFKNTRYKVSNFLNLNLNANPIKTYVIYQTFLLSVNTVFCVCQILYERIRTGGAAGFFATCSCDLLLQSD